MFKIHFSREKNRTFMQRLGKTGNPKTTSLPVVFPTILASIFHTPNLHSKSFYKHPDKIHPETEASLYLYVDGGLHYQYNSKQPFGLNSLPPLPGTSIWDGLFRQDDCLWTCIDGESETRDAPLPPSWPWSCTSPLMTVPKLADTPAELTKLQNLLFMNYSTWIIFLFLSYFQPHPVRLGFWRPDKAQLVKYDFQ